MRATAAERYAAAVTATHSGDPDMLAAAAIVAGRSREGVLALFALRALAGDRSGLEAIVGDLADAIMRASFRGRLAGVRKMSRPRATLAAAAFLNVWIAGSTYAESRENELTAIVFDRLEHLVSSFSRALDEITA